jgi:peptidoglycan hydrolase-like protein with peptidoglycan-binding domain
VVEPPPPPPAPPSNPYLVKGKAAILQVQKALVSLGYKIKKPDGTLGPATEKALAAFLKDRGLPEDSKLTLGLADKIRAAADEGRVTITAIAVRPGDFLVYSDGEEEVASAERSTTWEQDTPRALVAIRPGMASWPAAAKAGLDWALTHALDTPATAAPVKWSSTGVEEEFEIRTYASLTAREAGLVGGDPSSCRRFELKSDGSRYPGIACRDPDGTWYIPHSTVRLARPAAGLGTGAKGAGKKKS